MRDADVNAKHLIPWTRFWLFAKQNIYHTHIHKHTKIHKPQKTNTYGTPQAINFRCASNAHIHSFPLVYNLCCAEKCSQNISFSTRISFSRFEGRLLSIYMGCPFTQRWFCAYLRSVIIIRGSDTLPEKETIPSWVINSCG